MVACYPDRKTVDGIVSGFATGYKNHNFATAIWISYHSPKTFEVLIETLDPITSRKTPSFALMGWFDVTMLVLTIITVLLTGFTAIPGMKIILSWFYPKWSANPAIPVLPRHTRNTNDRHEIPLPSPTIVNQIYVAAPQVPVARYGERRARRRASQPA
ncbi:hypothetical protein EDC01DRAFT_658422 [Geopyxis carbonaria]|nr:hypothetical protein EDC01DRAFT_658422 [Geopyxis carbonaria]